MLHLLPSSLYRSHPGGSDTGLRGVALRCPALQQGASQLRALQTCMAVPQPAPSRRSMLLGTLGASLELAGSRAAVASLRGGDGGAAGGPVGGPRQGLPDVPNLVPAVAYQPKEQKRLPDVLRDAGRKALGGGIPGAAAMAIQVFTLMWLRTTVNYQYRYGTTTTVALRTLYKEGGIPRFYRGLLPALLQGPLSRFGDTAANAGALALLNEYESTANLPIWVKTGAASASAGAFRIFLMPVDAVKTIMQVEGKAGFPALVKKVQLNGPSVLYHGAIAASVATFVGHAPWFTTYNYLNELLPPAEHFAGKLGRSAAIGFCASLVSDTCSNSIRVVKTAKQASTVPVTYPEVVKMVIEKDGLLGLFGRGLKTKILANGLQGLLFSVLWRLGQDYWNAHIAQKH